MAYPKSLISAEVSHNDVCESGHRFQGLVLGSNFQDPAFCGTMVPSIRVVSFLPIRVS